jgi:hypothetical protein
MLQPKLRPNVLGAIFANYRNPNKLDAACDYDAHISLLLQFIYENVAFTRLVELGLACLECSSDGLYLYKLCSKHFVPEPSQPRPVEREKVKQPTARELRNLFGDFDY